MDGRRTLSFSSLAEVMPEVDRLMLGHRTVGRWSLAQICNHLSATLIATVDPTVGFPVRAPWIVRKTFGPLIIRHILKTGRFPEGIKMPQKYQPKAGLDARAEVEALRASIRLFHSHAGPLADHPLAGSTSRETWERLNAIHSAHHLSFAIPE